MKYGIIVFKKTRNIGDDIQSYAAKRFLPNIDYYIEREEINNFIPVKNELVTCILNGWYNHNKFSFPPSPFINPLFISMHLTSELKGEMPSYFTDYFFEYLKKNEPIGLRDNLIKKYLDEKNIKNYFSGCLTLTLQRFKNVKKKNNICTVDISENLKNFIKGNTKLEVIEKTHNLYGDNESKNYEERFKNVENLLKEYQAANLVVTNRLHCALPCLALDVPVILIYNEDSIDIKNRLGNYTGFLNCMSEEEFIANGKELLKNITPNPTAYKKYRDDLIDKITKFINESKTKKISKTHNVNLYNDYFVKRNKHLMDIMNNKINNYNEQIKKYEYELNKLYLIFEEYFKESKFSREQTAKIYPEYERFEKVKKTKLYFIYRCLKKMLWLIKKILKKIISLFRKEEAK